MASPSQAQELSRAIQARIEANKQASNLVTHTDTSDPSSVEPAPSMGKAEASSRNQIDEQKDEQLRTHHSRETTGAPLVSQIAARGSSPQNPNNNGPGLDHGNIISHSDHSKGVRDPLSSIEKLPELSKEQIRTLKSILTLIEVSTTSKLEFICGAVLQLAGLLFVVVFGVFAALAYDAANVSNKQSSEANQLALLNFCMGQNTPGDTCVAVSQNSLDSLSSLATAILGPGVILTTSTLSSSSVPTSTTTPTISATLSLSSNSTPTLTSNPTPSATPTPFPTPTPNGSAAGSSRPLSTPALVGTIVGVIVGLTSILISGCAFRNRFSHAPFVQKSSSPEGLSRGYSGVWRAGEDRTPMNV